MKKLTFEEVKKFIEEQSDCKLLSKEYIKAKIPLDLLCKCGNTFTVSFDVFKGANQRQCKKCGYNNCAKKQSFNIQQVKEIIEKDGQCTLLSTNYINSKTKLEFLCNCGEVFYRDLDAYRSGQRQCLICSEKKRISKRTLSYPSVQKYIRENSSCTLLSKEYVNSHTPLEFICDCGESFSVSFDKFKSQNKRQCNKCAGVYVPSIEEIKYEVEKHGCILISKNYINNRAELDYICHCGKPFSCTFEHFKGKKEKSCPSCNIENAAILKRTDIEDVKTFIIENSNCTPLFDEYKNNTKKLLLLCKCGEVFKKTFKDFKIKNQRQCINCSNIKSRGEQEIERILINNNFHYKFQYKIPSCKNQKVLPFDFAVFSNINEVGLICLIEYQGQQHYKLVNFGGKSIKHTENEFRLRQKNDEIKKKYCDENSIKLIEIPYWEFDNIEQILIESGIIHSYSMCV